MFAAEIRKRRVAGILDEIRASYTMKAERDIHDALFPPAEDLEVPGGGEEDIFFAGPAETEDSVWL